MEYKDVLGIYKDLEIIENAGATTEKSKSYVDFYKSTYYPIDKNLEPRTKHVVRVLNKETEKLLYWNSFETFSEAVFWAMGKIGDNIIQDYYLSYSGKYL